MQLTVIYQLVEGKDDAFTLCDEYVAFKNRRCYPVYKSEKTYTTDSTIGRVHVVFAKDYKSTLAVSLPLFGFSNDFELVKTSLLEDYARKANAYKRLKKKYENLLREQTTGCSSISG